MKTFKWQDSVRPGSYFISLLIALTLTACGGGGGSDAPAAAAPDIAATPTVVTKGIEGGGAVRSILSSENILTVGSKRLDVSSPGLMVTVDAQPAMVSDLRVGQQVQYAGTTSDDGATIEVSSISQDDLLEGPVDVGSIDLGAATFSVLGQPVRTDEFTVFSAAISPNDLSGLNDGDFVEVSGVLNAAGEIEASRVELEDSDTEVEVTGVIDSVDTAASTFVINGLVVDYSGARLEDFDGAEPAVGDLVEVEGTSVVAGQLVAAEVERETGQFTAEEGDLASIEGVVTQVTSETEFSVNGQPVITNASTVYEDGVAADLMVGVRVEVEGEFDAQGTLIATEIEFETDEEDSRIELEGTVEAVDATNQTLQLLGVIVQVDNATRLEGDDDQALEFANIATGNFVEVRGFASPGDGTVLLATRLELEDDGDESSVTGPASNIMEPMLSVFGVPVSTNGSTEFEDAGTATAFFQNLANGDFVKAAGTWDGASLAATEVESEDDD